MALHGSTSSHRHVGAAAHPLTLMSHPTARLLGLMRALQARGAVHIDHTISLLGDYQEDDDRRRHRVVVTGIGHMRTFSGRSYEEALEQAIASSPLPISAESDPFPSGPYRR